jgi:dienelactone hydrolase
MSRSPDLSSLLLVATLTTGTISGAQAAKVGDTTGTGQWPAYAESVDGFPDHTIFRPGKWPDGTIPVYLWGNGGCSANGMSHAAYLREIASHGYLVIALGNPQPERPRGTGPARGAGGPRAGGAGGLPPPPATPPTPADDPTQVQQHRDSLEWITRESTRAGGEFAGHVDLTRIAVGGHSCGGLQALAVSDDPRIKTTLVVDSGVYNSRVGTRSGVAIEKSDLAKLHAPVLYLIGGPSDIAYPNAADDFERINHVPVAFASLPVGHGGTFSQPNGGEWARVSTAWLDWQLKKNADAGKEFAGPKCNLCGDERWEYKQKNLPR